MRLILRLVALVLALLATAAIRATVDFDGDGVSDIWRETYPAAGAPGADPDGDGQNNLLEFLAATDPTDSSSVFTVRIAPVAGQPTHKAIVFGPVATARTYRVLASTDLGAASWTDISGPLTGASDDLTFTDTTATSARKFYRVQISNP